MDVDQRTASGARKTQYGLDNQDQRKTKKQFWVVPSSVMETMIVNFLSLIPETAGVDFMHLATLFDPAILVQQFIKSNCNHVGLFTYIELLILLQIFNAVNH